MDGAYFHLILCHIPAIGAAFTSLLLLFAIFIKSREFKRTALWFVVITGIMALITYFTGDSAEKVMLTLPGITESLIEPHEQFSLFFLTAIMIIAVVALAGLILSRASASALKKFVIIIFALLFLSSYFAVKTSETGMKIRHTELEKAH